MIPFIILFHWWVTIFKCSKEECMPPLRTATSTGAGRLSGSKERSIFCPSSAAATSFWSTKNTKLILECSQTNWTKSIARVWWLLPQRNSLRAIKGSANFQQKSICWGRIWMFTAFNLRTKEASRFATARLQSTFLLRANIKSSTAKSWWKCHLSQLSVPSPKNKLTSTSSSRKSATCGSILKKNTTIC